MIKPDPVLQVEHLSVAFSRKGQLADMVLQDISFSLQRGECLVVVGESGSGKTTLCRTLAGLLRPCGGQILVHGKAVCSSHQTSVSGISLIFQGQQALDNQLSLFEVLAEPLWARHLCATSAALQAQVRHLCKLTALDEALLPLPVAVLSGGQRQRAALARALAIKPHILLGDEFTAALDVLLQAQLINTLMQLKQEGLSLILVTHDLQLASCIGDRIAVMYAGRLVELARAQELYTSPKHPYTCYLLKAQLPLDPKRARALVLAPDDDLPRLDGDATWQQVSPEHWVLI